MATGTIGEHDSGWTLIPLSSDFEAYSSAYAPKYRKIGKVCYVNGVIKPKTDLPYGPAYTAMTMPSGARPERNIYFVGQASGQNRFSVEFSSGGDVKIDRYGTTSGATIPAGTFMPLTFSYPTGG